MKSFVIFLFLYLTLFQAVFVESGIILDNIQSGISNTRKTIRCGLHKVGGLFTHGQNVNCEEKKQEVNTNEINTDEGTVDGNVHIKPKVDEEVTKPKVEVVTEETEGKLSTSRNKTVVVPVPEGKRVIAVGANCPPGQRGDGKGNCREEY